MNFLHLFILACAWCVGQTCVAQEPTYVWGEPNTNDALEREIDQLLSLGDDGFVILRKFTSSTFVNTYWIESYSPDLALQSTQQVAFNGGVMGNSFDLEDIQVVNGKMYAFVSHWDKVAGQNSLAIKELSRNGELTDVAELDAITAKKMGNRGNFLTAFSPDGSKLLVLSEQPFVKKTSEKLKLTCFEVSSMTEIWSQDKELSWPSKKAYNNEIAVNDKGQAMLFKRIWQKPAWNYAIYSTNGTKWEEFLSLDLEGKEVADYNLEVTPDDQLFLYAIYTTEPSAYNKKLHGSCFYKLNHDLDMVEKRVERWDIEMTGYFIGEKRAASEKGHIPDLYIKDILWNSMGDMLILMEQLKKDSKIVTGSSPIQYTYEWMYGDFLMLNLNGSNGQLNWWQSFQKPQQQVTNKDVDYYGSYAYHLKNDRLYVLWNNTELSIPSIPPANWTEPDGTRYVKHKAFDEKTMHGTFMHVIEPDGALGYDYRTFGLPLFNLHQGAVFEMSLTTPFFFELNGSLVVMASMHNGGKRYRFGFVGL